MFRHETVAGNEGSIGLLLQVLLLPTDLIWKVFWREQHETLRANVAVPLVLVSGHSPAGVPGF